MIPISVGSRWAKLLAGGSFFGVKEADNRGVYD